ncbi:MAG TPA: hypothetical protein VK145_00335 [Candidatus Nanoarchaeia archaeon]|nr:hypothetical protein [Candidatus Nanoarchaeia archaeon]
MEYLKKRQKVKRRLYSKITVAGLVILFLLLIRPTWSMYQKSQETKKNLREAERELSTLEMRKAELQRDLNYVKSEPGFDQEIRDKFGVAKKDETMIVIVRDEEKDVVPPPPPKPTVWARFKSWFGLE